MKEKRPELLWTVKDLGIGMENSFIHVRGAKEHNLKNISLSIPKNRFTVVTGVSGSGKSSLAFDTLHAEAQRRYMESLSVYSRQFLEQFEKPEVDAIDGIIPSIAIEQKTSKGSPRSTVATITNIYDYLKLLFAYIGQPHHPVTGKKLKKYTIEEMAEKLLSLPMGTSVMLLAPLIKKAKEDFIPLLEQMQKEGFLRARIGGQLIEIEEARSYSEENVHKVEVVVDRIQIEPDVKSRLYDSLELALRVGKGVVCAVFKDNDGKETELQMSNLHYDPETGYLFQDLSPKHFSYNSPFGACPSCHGLGTEVDFDPDLIIPDPSVPLKDNPFVPWEKMGGVFLKVFLEDLLEQASIYGESPDKSWKDCSEEFKKTILYGTTSNKKKSKKPFEGVIPALRRIFKESSSALLKSRLKDFLFSVPCRVCQGQRLNPEILSVTIEIEGWPAFNISQAMLLTAFDSLDWAKSLYSLHKEDKGAREILSGLITRLENLVELGVGYLELNRQSSTLSGGESQRVRLASLLSGELTGLLYVLDEPSIGLHPRDTAKLIKMIKKLKELGNTILVVEHDEYTIREADFIVELGPGAGTKGGELIYTGPFEELLKSKKSLTGAYLRGELSIPVPPKRRKPRAKWIRLYGVKEHNLKNIDVSIPVGLFCCVTGVSGSGKSTLVNDVLAKIFLKHLQDPKIEPGSFDRVEGLSLIKKIVVIDQSPIARSMRSNPASYSGVLTLIRELFAKLPKSKILGFSATRFSFNVPGGRCERCKGEGVIEVEMAFLSPVYVVCEACQGKRFNRETLEVTYRGKNIADILDMTIEEGCAFFRNIPELFEKLELMANVGLGYLKLGQPFSTLSGGEAQRIKLAVELLKGSEGKTLYILDEPTTGLHFADIDLLLRLLHNLVDRGNTVVVIEHNLEVIKSADYVIDLGPEGGSGGGYVVVAGSPEEVAGEKASWTGKYLQPLVKQNRS
uniref:excinuclease ABC subunit UvrA n=1 Tax=Methylacidiphilum caldifontis TaxID=2795386 RepID=UPI001F5D1FBF|nr:excinuclease ABC subunit UvrA [Methylacidiphilum caldifontis]